MLITDIKETKLTEFEINNLIEMYYNRIEDLEDLNCISNFENGKYSFVDKSKAEDLFKKLL